MSDAGSGRLVMIWVKRAPGGPMDAAESASLVAGRGIAGNANQGGKRQVTILEREAWEAMMAELGGSLASSARRANLVVSGIRLAESRGRMLRVGPCRLLVNGETRPCEQMDAALPGLREAMGRDWRGGVYAEVLDDGEIAVGEPVAWALDDSNAAT
jgi:MOSC domain-containing protein YiiM